MSVISSIQTQHYLITVNGDLGPFKLSLEHSLDIDGVEYITVQMNADKPSRPTPLILSWDHPMINTHYKWFPGTYLNRTILPVWSKDECISKATSNAPVYALFSTDGTNALTFALSDALNVVKLQAGLAELTAMVHCEIKLFTEPMPITKKYETRIRLDTRDIQYYKVLQDVSDWWASMPDYKPSPIPEHARRPIYSSWYSFHQDLSPEKLEKQCRLAKEMGMESIIVDDGWQTDDTNRGYAYCGDWEVTKNKLPDFQEHVKRVHEIGLKYMLWFSVPAVGIHSKAYKRFKEKLLNPSRKHNWFVLDPRFPEVREYLITLYERFVRDYDIDGLKLDFIDTFHLTEETKNSFGEGRDFDSVQEAVDCLLIDIINRLRTINPDILIEFRQKYIGPIMRKYGNMFRALDVPNDYCGNRVRTIDIRLLCGNTPAHSDMFMWHKDDSVESAAMHIIHTLFSVPQVSVLLDKIPRKHVKMIKYLINFWKENRDVLLDGELIPSEPGMLYPYVCARNDNKILAAWYSDSCITIDNKVPPKLILVNGTFNNRVIIQLEHDLEVRNMVISSCTGSIIKKGQVNLSAGIHYITLPPAGIGILTSSL
ncbi:MAG: alpha-galactosidase [Candidatus Heimdallarchaeota archaeon]|nr:alpha-galactosidase [Candidatus Heimdallarchaeota archaeon]